MNYGDYIEISGCDKSATEIVIPSEIEGVPVTSIGERAFVWRESLTSVTIPDSVTSIENSTFFACSSLTSIEIPNSVTSIGNFAFGLCKSLTEITILNSECEIYDDDVISNEYDLKTQKPYFDGTIYGYENSTAQAYAEKYNREFKIIGQEDVAGDMNGDGSLNIADAVLLQNYILGKQKLTEKQLKSADMNSDSFVDSFDLVLLRREIIENK